jgi:hypothetical protein
VRTDVIETLLSTHVPNVDGLCRACTTPGRGTPQKKWPCSMWSLADAARQARAKRLHRSQAGCPQMSKG